MGVLGDIFSGVAGLASTAYNISTNKRDFDYQKALQQQIFEREDTAVQRRVEDLKAAGLNPALANGSAASAGSVVSRSNTNDVNFGSALDYIAAANNIKQQREQTKILQHEEKKAQYEASIASMNTTLNRMQLFNQLGIDYGVKPFVKDGDLVLDFKFKHGDYALKNEMPFYSLFKYQNDYNKNAADIIQKQNDWFNTNQILNIAGGVLPSLKYIH